MTTKTERRRENFGAGAGQVKRTNLRRWHDMQGHRPPSRPTPPASRPPRRGWGVRSFWKAWALQDAAARRAAKAAIAEQLAADVARRGRHA